MKSRNERRFARRQAIESAKTACKCGWLIPNINAAGVGLASVEHFQLHIACPQCGFMHIHERGELAQ